MCVCLLWRINVFISWEWILWKFWESRPWDKNNWLDLEWSVSRNFSFLLNFNTQIAKLYCYSVDVSNNIIPMLLLVSLISTLSGSLTLRILRSPWRRFELVECSYFYTELMHCGCMVLAIVTITRTQTKQRRLENSYSSSGFLLGKLNDSKVVRNHRSHTTVISVSSYLCNLTTPKIENNKWKSGHTVREISGGIFIWELQLRCPGDGSPSLRSRGEASVGIWGTSSPESPQKIERFADIVYRFWLQKWSKCEISHNSPQYVSRWGSSNILGSNPPSPCLAWPLCVMLF